MEARLHEVSDIVETPQQEAEIFMGRIGSREVVEVDDLPIITAPDGSIGISGDTVRQLALEMGSDSVLWVRSASEPAPVPSNEANGEPAPPDILLAGGKVRIEQSASQLIVEDKIIEMQPLPYKILEYMSQRVGRTVTRDELINIFWGGYTSPTNINVNVSAIRRALGDYSWIVHSRYKLGYLIDDRERARKPGA